MEEVMSGSSLRYAPLPLRIFFGLHLAYHGFPKLFSQRGQASFIHILEGMGVPLPSVMVWVIGGLEFGGGLMLLTGALTRLMATVVAGEVIINIVGALIRGGFPEPLPGGDPLPDYQMSLAYLAGMLSLIAAGPGEYAIDELREA